MVFLPGNKTHRFKQRGSSKLFIEMLSNPGSFPSIHNNQKAILKVIDLQISLPHLAVTVAYEGSEETSNPGRHSQGRASQ